MKEFDKLLKKFDLHYFGTGIHKTRLEKAMDMIKEKKAVLLDVRTHEEIEFLKIGNVIHIPLSSLPDKLEDIPKNKTVIIFCSSAVRSVIAWTYLNVKGFENIKILTSKIEEIAGYFKPGNILKMKKKN